MPEQESIFSKHTASIATILAAIIGVAGLFALEAYKTSNSEVEEKPISVIESSSAVTPNIITSQGLSLDDVLATLSDDNLSGLQLQNFIKNNSGRVVTWKVLVRDVRPVYENDMGSDIFLIFQSVESEKLFPDISIARFPRDSEAELSSLSEGDIAVIKGEMKFISGGSWSVNLENPSLLKFSKPNKSSKRDAVTGAPS